MAMIGLNDINGGFQGIPGQPPGGVDAAGIPGQPPGMGAPGQPPPYIPRSLTLREYVEMARAKKMIPRFTNVAGQGGDFSEAWMGREEGQGNAFLQPGEYKADPAGGAIPVRQPKGGQPGAPADAGPAAKPQKNIGEMTPQELRNVDIYGMALEKTRGQIPGLFKHVFGDRAQSPRDLNAKQLKHWQKQVQAINNHNIKVFEKQLERSVKMFSQKDLLKDGETKEAASAQKEAEADYRDWQSSRKNNPMSEEDFPTFRKKKREAIQGAVNEKLGKPSAIPSPAAGAPAAAPKSKAPQNDVEMFDIARDAFKASGGDRKEFERIMRESVSGKAQAPAAAIPGEEPYFPEEDDFTGMD